MTFVIVLYAVIVFIFVVIVVIFLLYVKGGLIMLATIIGFSKFQSRDGRYFANIYCTAPGRQNDVGERAFSCFVSDSYPIFSQLQDKKILGTQIPVFFVNNQYRVAEE